ncbi:MAG: chemotaxis protein CheW [Lachnospiraceae bacterium]|jgi:purine-binding chemotaxis protein CheW|nr:chemotaxis protein CheW [Lachnospiraceae bacterium]
MAEKVLTNETKQVIFALGEEEYGLDIMVVNAIEKYTDIVRIPNAPSYIHGIINLRGEVIPVYNLRKKFGFAEKAVDENSKLIVARTNNMKMAYEVDEVKGIMEIPAANISDTPVIVKSAATTYMKNVASLNGRMIILLDHDGIVSEKELEKIESILTD